MLHKDLVEKNPLRVLYPADTEGTVAPRMGLVMARAGLGKTAILVQIALDSLLCGNQVLHVSIGQTLDKIRTWYDDIFKDIAEEFKLENTTEIMTEIYRNRLIMTFNESSFSRPKLEERLNDLVYQNIFRPNCLVIDGFDFAAADREILADIQELATVMDLNIWFSATSHRDDQRVSAAGIPAPCHEVDDLFDTVIVLQPKTDEKCIALNIIKDATKPESTGKSLNLDPATLMLKEPYDASC